ncbi:MAG: hypothetical protein ACO3CC_01335 [Alphaproteobacteria bacterium]
MQSEKLAGPLHLQRAVIGVAEQLGLANVVFRPFQPRGQLPLSLGVPARHVV